MNMSFRVAMLSLLVAVSMVTPGEATSTTAPEVCGQPPDMPEDVVPGVPHSNVIEPIGPGPNVCVGRPAIVQEVIWRCETRSCCQEPCVCDSGHHSEHGCGELTPLKLLRCYVQNFRPLRTHAWECCSGYEMDEFRKCLPIVDCSAPGGSVCQHACVPGQPDTCACPQGYDVTNRTQCTVPTSPTPTTLTTASRPVTTPTTTSATKPVPAVNDGHGGPDVAPSTHEGTDNLPIILGILVPLFLLLLLCILIICCCRRCKRKPPPTPQESVNAAFTNQTYDIIKEEEGAVGGTFLIVAKDEKKKLPPDDVGYDNAGYLMAKQVVDPPPPYTEKPHTTFNDKLPVPLGVVAVANDDIKKNPVYDNSYESIGNEKKPLPDGDIGMTVVGTLPNAYEEIPFHVSASQPADTRVASEQNEVNEINEAIYYDID